MIQWSYFWAYNPEKTIVQKDIFNVHSSTIYNSQDMEAT